MTDTLHSVLYWHFLQYILYATTFLCKQAIEHFLLLAVCAFRGADIVIIIDIIIVLLNVHFNIAYQLKRLAYIKYLVRGNSVV